jgi:hypothetical protein
MELFDTSPIFICISRLRLVCQELNFHFQSNKGARAVNSVII